jgi:hypothetical protein
VHVSWAPERAKAEELAHHQWRSNIFPPPACWDIDSPATFDAVSEQVPVEQVAGTVNISEDLGWHTARLAEYAELGFDEIALHHVGVEQDEFLDAFGNSVLPQLRGSAPATTAEPAAAGVGA